MNAISELRHRVGRTVRNLRRDRSEGVGHDFITDLRNRLPLPIQTVFDVGAHIGITALQFSDEFPDASVWAFEPHPGNFKRMQSNLVGKPDIKLFEFGFSDKADVLKFHFDPEHPSMARIADDGETQVVVETIDRFCDNREVARIDLMKIDVEGHEMPVLKGAHNMLSEGRIGVLKLETTLDPDLGYHTQLTDLCDYLHPFGYRLFGFYDQFEDVFTDSPKLRRFDAAFISSQCCR